MLQVHKSLLTLQQLDLMRPMTVLLPLGGHEGAELLQQSCSYFINSQNYEDSQVGKETQTL